MAKEIMNYQRCKRDYLMIVERDIDKIKSILKMSGYEIEILETIDINKKTASKLAKDYYEIIKELLIALLLTEGKKSSNHECLISFFKEKYPKFEFESTVIHELKNIRNRINYDDYFVEQGYINQNLLEFRHIIKLLKKLIKENVPEMGQEDR